jgi:hypothetical protein
MLMRALGHIDGDSVTATGFRCGSFGTELPPDSRFCNKCGAPITRAATSAEYKQVTVLFADMVRSMTSLRRWGPSGCERS